MRTALLIILIVMACTTPDKKPKISIQALETGSEASFRALAVVDESAAWASGTGGTILRTVDAGTSWENVSSGIPDSIDFRDIEAFSANEALLLSSGSPGLVYRTEDGGSSWELVYKDYRPEIFFDGMDFWNTQSGIAFGDAINGFIEVIVTNDGGKSWQQMPPESRPVALAGEGGFAASGTCITTFGDSSVWIALGTPESRIAFSADRGNSWQFFSTPMQQETGSSGIFSIAFNKPNYGIGVGGDYQNRASTTKLIAKTTDAGKTWNLVENNGLNGQKSAVTPIPETDYWLSTGATGVNISWDNGDSWNLVDSTGYYTIEMASKKVGWLTGPQGRTARLEIIY